MGGACSLSFSWAPMRGWDEAVRGDLSCETKSHLPRTVFLFVVPQTDSISSECKQSIVASCVTSSLGQMAVTTRSYLIVPPPGGSHRQICSLRSPRSRFDHPQTPDFLLLPSQRMLLVPDHTLRSYARLMMRGLQMASIPQPPLDDSQLIDQIHALSAKPLSG